MYIYFGQQAWAHVRCIALLLTSRQLKLSRDILWTLNNASELGVITLVEQRVYLVLTSVIIGFQPFVG